MNYNKRKSIVIWTHLKIWVKSGQTSFRYNQNIWVPIQGRSRWKSWRLSRTKINCVRSNLILAQNTYSVDCGFLYKEAKYLRKQTRLKSLTVQCAAQKRWFWAAGSRLCCWQNGEKEEEEWVLCTGCLTWADHQDHGSVPACPAWALVVDLPWAGGDLGARAGCWGGDLLWEGLVHSQIGDMEWEGAGEWLSEWEGWCWGWVRCLTQEEGSRSSEQASADQPLLASVSWVDLLVRIKILSELLIHHHLFITAPVSPPSPPPNL